MLEVVDRIMRTGQTDQLSLKLLRSFIEKNEEKHEVRAVSA